MLSHRPIYQFRLSAQWLLLLLLIGAITVSSGYITRNQRPSKPQTEWYCSILTTSTKQTASWQTAQTTATDAFQPSPCFQPHLSASYYYHRSLEHDRNTTVQLNEAERNTRLTASFPYLHPQSSYDAQSDLDKPLL